MLYSAKNFQTSGLHVAIIMDGNGRWAAERGQPRLAGHRAGADAVRRTVEAAPGLGVRILTLYAFSSDNWQRPRTEVAELMKLLRVFLVRETPRCLDNGVRVSLVGRRDRLPRLLLPAIEAAERATAGGRQIWLRVAVDYSSRDAILAAAARLRGGAKITRESFALALGDGAEPAPDVDLLIRTSGEQRLSDFLLWECAYAELLFTRRMWPDFGAADLRSAIEEFERRDRRFGRVPAAV